MKVEIAIAIGVAWFIVRAVMRAIKNNKANLQRGGQNSNSSGNSAQDFIDTAAAERNAQVLADQAARAANPTAMDLRSLEGRSLERPTAPKPQKVLDPFLEPTSLENQRGHYNEEALVEEYTTTHAQGKTVSHHKHQLFDASQDRIKAARHSRNPGKDKNQDATYTRAERRVKKVHPIAKALAAKGGRKQAVIMAEIMQRREW